MQLHEKFKNACNEPAEYPFLIKSYPVSSNSTYIIFSFILMRQTPCSSLLIQIVNSFLVLLLMLLIEAWKGNRLAIILYFTSVVVVYKVNKHVSKYINNNVILFVKIVHIISLT